MALTTTPLHTAALRALLPTTTILVNAERYSNTLDFTMFHKSILRNCRPDFSQVTREIQAECAQAYANLKAAEDSEWRGVLMRARLDTEIMKERAEQKAKSNKRERQAEQEDDESVQVAKKPRMGPTNVGGNPQLYHEQFKHRADLEIAWQQQLQCSVKNFDVTFNSSFARHLQFSCVAVRFMTGKVIEVLIDKEYDTFDSLRFKIWETEGIPIEEQRLLIADKPVPNDAKLKDHISEGTVLQLVVCMRGGGPPVYHQDLSIFNPPKDFDLTAVKAAGQPNYTRGGKVYQRPFGCKRLALRVDRYGPDNTWFGADGIRSASSPGEWAVSYHGTGYHNGLSIGSRGYLLAMLRRDLYGKGIYSTPELDVAMCYAPVHVLPDGRRIQVVMQNRVNPATLKIVPRSVTHAGEYWISPNEDDVRPYGICVKVIYDPNDRPTPAQPTPARPTPARPTPAQPSSNSSDGGGWPCVIC